MNPKDAEGMESYTFKHILISHEEKLNPTVNYFPFIIAFP